MSFCLLKRRKFSKNWGIFVYVFLLFFWLAFTFPFVLIQKKSNKRKNQGCTFLATPALFYAKQKELANAQTAFCF